MSTLQRNGNQQLLREAEGYLDLISALADHYQLRTENVERLARRALATLDRIIDHTDRRSRWLHLRGLALKALGRYREAIVDLEEATELDPYNLHLWLDLGYCHRRGDRLDLAIQALEEALMIDGCDAIVHYNLACYWSLANSPKLAVAYLTRAVEIDSNYRDRIADERDFDPIRGHSAFAQLTRIVI